MAKPTVVIADSNPAERVLLRFYLAGADTPCSLVDPAAGPDGMAAHQPHIVLLEGDNSAKTWQTCARLRELRPGVTVVIISDAARPTLVAGRARQAAPGPDAALLRPL